MSDAGERLGATLLGDGRCRFSVWAPRVERIEVELVGATAPLPLQRDGSGYHRGEFGGIGAGARYRLRLDGDVERPDPASRSQPDGVHGASEVVDLAFAWRDAAWSGIPLASYVTYELHPGTFSAEGTFAAIVPHLERLRALGVTAIEIMPVAEFPGARNWGYDGVCPFAAHSAYGGPRALQRLVDACHAAGLAVVLDVVYNHLGPEGNYLGDFGPYFTDVYTTPWGRALNFDGPDSDHVRRYFVENALQWIDDFHVDALRLDAVHAILDRSAYPFLEQLADAVGSRARQRGRQVHLIAESDTNDPRLVRPSTAGGCGLDAFWCDDLHHALHALLTGETAGYYADFGGLRHLQLAWQRGMTYAGEASRYRRRRHGRPAAGLEPHRVVVCAQNHDQVGNRMFGERLSTLVDFESNKLAAGVVLLSPHLPLLFMGEEYGETAPFLYFVSHGDPELVEAVRKGRSQEFAAFAWQGEAPDPQAEATFARCKLRHELAAGGRHAAQYRLYRELLALRGELAAAADQVEVVGADVLAVQRGDRAWMVFHFGERPCELTLPLAAGDWRRRLCSADPAFDGPGTLLPDRLRGGGEVRLSLPPRGFAVYSAAANTANEVR